MYEMGDAANAQRLQLFDSEVEMAAIRQHLDLLESKQRDVSNEGTALESELKDLLNSIQQQSPSKALNRKIEGIFAQYDKAVSDQTPITRYDIMRTREILINGNWENYYLNVQLFSKDKGVNATDDPFLTSLGEGEYAQLEDKINSEFTQKTSISNKIDLNFLAIAIAMCVAKGLLYPLISRAAGYGTTFDPNDRKNHDDPSIKKTYNDAKQDFQNSHKNSTGHGSWEDFLTRPVPYDITNGTGCMTDLNLHGGSHRLYTLGHDPILGWIFGTSNILIDAITVAPCAVIPTDGHSKQTIAKMITMRTYHVQRVPRMYITSNQVSTAELFMESVQVSQEYWLNLPAAIFVESQHLLSDRDTKLGLPVPVIQLFSPDCASNLYKSHYDALCLARDAKIIGTSATISLFIDTIIGLVHGLFYNPNNDGSRDLYEVRTRKILLIANAIGTSSNLILAYLTKDARAIDAGSLLITVGHLFTDPRFFLQIKKEFIEQIFSKKLEAELIELNKIEEDLIAYGTKHRALYK